MSLSSVEKDKRFNTYGIPCNKSKTKKADAGKETVPNGNYLWINLFATSLKPKGRAALVMPTPLPTRAIPKPTSVGR